MTTLKWAPTRSALKKVVAWRPLKKEYLLPSIYEHAERYGWDRGLSIPDSFKMSPLFQKFAINTKVKLDQDNTMAIDVWLNELFGCLRWRLAKMLSREKSKSAKKRRLEEQDSSNSASTSKRQLTSQQTSQPAAVSEIIVRFSVGEKNVIARSLFLSKLVDENAKPDQLSAVKLLHVVDRKYPALSKNGYNIYDRTYKDENIDTIVDDDDLEVAVTTAMQRGEIELYFVVVSKEDATRSRLTSKRFSIAGVRIVTNNCL